jgi:predicted RNA-binding Zn ribbon-like protein
MKNPRIDQLRLDGGVLCLDFVNTIPDRKDGSNRDYLGSYNDLVYWARKSKAINGPTFTALEKAGATRERSAKDYFNQALQLRDLIYRLFYPLSQQTKIKTADLDAFNKTMSRYAANLIIVPSEGGFSQKWEYETAHFQLITAPIIKSAQDLLLSDKLARIKECPSCGWLFLDTTKNGRRRWCSMEDCGSNVKALQYYYRKKNESQD